MWDRRYVRTSWLRRVLRAKKMLMAATSLLFQCSLNTSQGFHTYEFDFLCILVLIKSVLLTCTWECSPPHLQKCLLKGL